MPEVHTSTAPEADLVRAAERKALDEVAEREGKVEDVRDAHKRAFQELLLERVRGTDGEAALENLPDLAEAEKRIDDEAVIRERRIRRGVIIAHFEGNKVGEERDHDRSVRIEARLASVDAEEAQTREVDEHEHRHTQQKPAGEDAPPPETGIAELDEKLQLGTLEYREWGAMKAAGDQFTSAEYHREYKEPVEETREFLSAHGEDGDRLVEDAEQSGNIVEIRQAIVRAHIREVLGDEVEFDESEKS
jgi:hypothetical protein